MRRRGRRGVATALTGLVIILLAAVAAPLFTPDPRTTDLDARLRPPSLAHPFGQDALGRDVLARVLGGARVALGVAAVSVAISLALGVLFGALAGFAGGWVDVVISRLIDVFLAVPGLLLAIALAAVLGPGVGNVVIALSVLGWTGYARLARGEVARLARRDFAQAARALGATPGRIVGRHLLPLAAPSLLVQPPPDPTWGGMLDEGRQFLLVAPHLVVFPGTALAGTVLLFQLLGDSLRDLLDVREEGV
jgi:peptide/nickel transport system permease protein